MEKIALLPGGFKPPHAGHYNMAKWLVANTDADSVVIKIGSKERDGITRDISLKLWDLYRKSDKDSGKLVIVPSEQNSPVRDVYDFIEQDAPEGSTVYLGMGEKDIEDQRFKNIGKFAEPKNIKFKTVLVPPQAGGVSGTEMRGFISSDDKESFQQYLPDHLNAEQKDEAWGIVSSIQEDFYDPRNKMLDYMRSSEWKAGMPDGSKKDIPRTKNQIHNRQRNPHAHMSENNLNEQIYIPEDAGCMQFCDPVDFSDPNNLLGEEQLLIVPICLPGYKPEDSEFIESYQFMFGYNNDILQWNQQYSQMVSQMPQLFGLSNALAGGMGIQSENQPGVVSYAFATGEAFDWSETDVLTYLVFVVTGNGTSNFTWNQNAGGTDVNPNMTSYYVYGVTDCFEDGSASVNFEEEDSCNVDNIADFPFATSQGGFNSVEEFCNRCEVAYPNTVAWAEQNDLPHCDCCSQIDTTTSEPEEESYSCPEGTINNMGSQFITPGLTINCDPEIANTENIDSAPENMWIGICCDEEEEGLPPLPNKDKAPLKDKPKKEPIKKPIKKEPLKEQQGKTLKTYGDLQGFIDTIRHDKANEKYTDIVDKAIGLIPYLGTVKSGIDVIKALLSKQDGKTTNTFLDKMDIDDKASAIVDDKVEANFINYMHDVLVGADPNTSLPSDFDMNDYFVAFLSSEYDKRTIDGIQEKILKEQQGKILRVYDFDDTLAVTKGANIKIKHTDGSIDTLNPAEFAVYDEQEGDKFDFTEFDRVIKDAEPIQNIISMLRKDLETTAKVTILTARLIAYPVRRYLKSLNLDAYVVAVGSSDPNDKAKWIKNHIEKGYDNILFIDDSEKNRNAVTSLKDEYPDIKLDVKDPDNLTEMIGTMNNQEKRKHKRTLKTIKKDLKKYDKNNKYFEVPKNWKGSLKRKLYENKYYIDNSNIHGIGVFASNNYPENTTIGKFHDILDKGYDFTELGSSHNHSETPNCKNVFHNNSRHMVTIKPVKKGEELTTNYKLQPDLEQPEDFKTKMTPQKDGYRTYSPFKELPYIDIPGNLVDTSNLAYDQLLLVGDNGKEMVVNNNSGIIEVPGADNVREIPLINGIPLAKYIKEDHVPKLHPEDPYNHDETDSYTTSNALINDLTIPLEIMKTPEDKITGMMDREKLIGGIMYPYDEVSQKDFNTEDYLIPLDIIFINKGTVGDIHSNCPPCKTLPCPKYSGLADNVLEMPGGYCKKHNINVGDKVNLNLTEIKIVKEIKYGSQYLLTQHKKQIQSDHGPQQYRNLQLMMSQQKDEEVEIWLKSKGYTTKNENFPPYKANQVQQVRYKASDVFTRDIKKAKKMGYKENVFTKGWWKKIINEILTEGGAAGHMAHPFNLSNVNSGKDLLDVFNKAAKSLEKDPGSVKIDGVNSSIRLIDLDGEKQFVMDRGSKKELDIKGITKDDLLSRFGDGHGMVKIGGEVLDMFNKALPSIKGDLEKLGAYDDPNILFNMEYVSGKTNVQDYGSNFIAIHGLNKIESKEVQGKRKMLTKRVSSEISYDKSDLQSLLNNLTPTAKEKGFEVYGSVPTEMTKKPNFNSALSKSYTIEAGENTQTKSLNNLLDELNNIPEEDFIFMNVNNSRKKVGAVSKQVYLAILNGENVDDLFEDEDDKQKAIEGFTTYLATEKLGDEVLKVLNSPMGSVENHEGVVIRDEKIANVPFKITGKFILGGMVSDF